MARRLAIVLSFVGHGLLLSGWIRAQGRPPTPGRVGLAKSHGGALVARANAATKGPRLLAARKALVLEARNKLRAGTLSLGDFLLRASEIDASEQDRTFDVARARFLYEERVTRARAALATEDLRLAVSKVFSDLRYFGRPGGLVADTLLDRGGSCEPISQLVVATLYDAGRGADVALRYYGGADETGASHLAPVTTTAEGEFDLMSGRPAHRRGALFAPQELIEAYARAHGLAARLPVLAGTRTGGGAASPSSEGGSSAPATGSTQTSLPTMTGGYPPNQDRFPGSVPMYAAQAVLEKAGANSDGLPAIDAADMARDCAFYVRMAVLDPPKLRVAESSFVELRRLPRPSELERKASWIRGVEEFVARPSSDEADRLMGLACLVTLGERAAIDFTLAGETHLATIAQTKSQAALKTGNGLLASLPWSAPRGALLRGALSERYPGRTWLLIALEGGSEVVFDLVTAKKADDWGHINALAALTVAPRTRERALVILRRLPRRDQIDVMHEVFHAHDDQRPWGSNYAFEPDRLEAEGDFQATYHVFRGLAWRLWEGQRPLAETLKAFDAEANDRGLDAEWRALLLEYYARNLLGLEASRESGLAVVRALRAEIGARRHPHLERLLARLDELDSRSRLDSVTIADAWRIR